MNSLFFAILAAAMILAYRLLLRRYNVILSGGVDKHKRRFIKTLKKNLKDSVIFTNLPLQHGRHRSEADVVIIGKQRVILLEIITRSGIITGAETDVFWTCQKTANQKPEKMLNPVFQLKRQSKIIRKLLAENGADVWIENILFFSSPDVKLNLSLSENNRAFHN